MKALRLGDEGVFVIYLQKLLQRAGENPGNLDGIFGRRTNRALMAFQNKYGLQADGIAGRLTLAALYPFLCGYTVTILSEDETLEDAARRFNTNVVSIITANPNFLPGHRHEILIPLSFDVVFTDVPYTSFLTAAVIEGLCIRYPFLTRNGIGNSVTGKRIETIRIGSGPFHLGVNAAHHANEWITTPLTLMFIEKFAEAIAFDKEIGNVSAKQIFKHATLTLAPLVNPDGVDLVNGVYTQGDSYYESAKALSGFYPTIPFPSGWRANILGIDLNLGYPAGWERARAIKFAHGYTRPGPRDYVGTHPFQSPENQAMLYLTEHEQFDRTISYHTQGREIYSDYNGEIPVGSKELADRFASVSGYSAVSAPFESSFAGYKDWFISEYGKCGFTIEAGKGINPLPLSELSNIYEENKRILIAALTERVRA